MDRISLQIKLMYDKMGKVENMLPTGYLKIPGK